MSIELLGPPQPLAPPCPHYHSSGLLAPPDHTFKNFLQTLILGLLRSVRLELIQTGLRYPDF